MCNYYYVFDARNSARRFRVNYQLTLAIAFTKVGVQHESDAKRDIKQSVISITRTYKPETL
ncbi:hypothetical protein SAMN04515617_12153 [Collimonas sp. OK242]|jgi:outer membrane protein assembly factor BamE (lipoprotein component of BamABCDE complex)|nr:hypothetical protein SAMN04515617_12153 [Collimonas sp. OK242]